jgi:hypothetical protein
MDKKERKRDWKQNGSVGHLQRGGLLQLLRFLQPAWR